MSEREETPLTNTERKIQFSPDEASWFWSKRRSEVAHRSFTAEMELAILAYHRFIRECAFDEGAALLILQQENVLIEREYKPVQQEVRQRVRNKERLITIGLEQQQ